MTKYPFGNNPKKIEKYKAFWERKDVERPLVGFTFRGFFPKEEYCVTRSWQSDMVLRPDMIEPEEFMEDEEKLLKEGEIIDDDIIRGDSPASAIIPWLSAILGRTLKVLPGNIYGKDLNLSWEQIEDISLNYSNPWFNKYIEFAKTLVKKSNGRFPVSHGAFLGPSDLLGFLRGTGQSIIDLIEEPNKSMDVLWKLADIFIEVTEVIWKHLPLFYGGYFDGMYQLWAPGSIARLQEDASALYSPELCREFLLPVNKKIASHFSNSFIHLHSTSMFLLETFLEVEEIKCFEINNDDGGPSIEKMIPYFQMVQKAKRSLLIRGSFASEEIDLLMNNLNCRGLYLLILVKNMDEIDKLKHIVGMD
jgi:hypothetical protein